MLKLPGRDKESTPFILIVPYFYSPVEINLPDKKFSKVVFPAPDAPIIDTNSPGKTDPLISLIIERSLDSWITLPQHPLGASATILILCQEIETLF